MTAITIAEKTCPACDETKPLSEWSRARANKDGLHYECKACNRKRTIANNERLRERMGEDEYKAWKAEVVRRSRKNPDVRERGRKQAAAWSAAATRLREAHPDEFAAIYARERYERGLT